MQIIRHLVIILSLVTLMLLRYAANIFDLGIITSYTLVGAFCILCGYASNKSFLFPILGLLLLFGTDIAINEWVYHGKYGLLEKGWWVTYLCFGAIMLINRHLPTFKKYQYVIASSVVSSILFWMISDFQYWYFIGTNIYTQQPLPSNFAGFLTALSQGAPFIKNFFVGTLAYTSIFYLIINWAPKWSISAKNVATNRIQN